MVGDNGNVKLHTDAWWCSIVLNGYLGQRLAGNGAKLEAPLYTLLQKPSPRTAVPYERRLSAAKTRTSTLSRRHTA